MTEDKRPLVIFDTDMDTDCDDAGALALLYEYVKRGRAELLGIVADVVCPWAAPCCEAMGNYYGILRPVGTVASTAYPPEETDRYVRYRAHSAACDSHRYNKTLAARVGKTDADYPAAARMYRQLLAGAPDHSVTVVCVGLLTALAELLETAGDDICPLTGEELLAKKAQRVISMGYPEKTGGNFNWEMDGEAAELFMNRCPVPVYVSGYGGSVITGHTLSEKFPADHPMRMAYEAFTGKENCGRSSWDLIAVLHAVEPDAPVLTAVEKGTSRFEKATGRSYWESGERRDFDILPAVSDEALAAYLEARITGEF